MEVNIEALKRLLHEQFSDNQSLLAEKIGVERTHLNKVLNSNGKGAGANFCGAIIKYCNDNNIDYQKFIILS